MNLVKKINNLFSHKTRKEIDDICKVVDDELILTDRQRDIFEMKYIKKHDINFIADTLNISSSVVCVELKYIRKMLDKVLHV